MTQIIGIHKEEGEIVRFEITLEEMLDAQRMLGPIIPGILLSDLLDHIVNAIHKATDRDQKDIRADILKVMKDEDRFKAKDPERSGMKGYLNRH